jgi:isochorismate pyruvate lyase
VIKDNYLFITTYRHMKKPKECQCIEEVRQEIDEIDNEIIGLIGKRFSFIKEIVKYKRNIDDVYAKKRYKTVISKRRELAVSNNLDPDIIERIYRIMMDYFINEQLELLKKKEK